MEITDNTENPHLMSVGMEKMIQRRQGDCLPF